MYRKYYSYNDMPTPLNKNENTQPIHKAEEVKREENKFFGKFETDDIVIAVVIIMLLANDCDDKLLLLALAFVFFSGI